MIKASPTITAVYTPGQTVTGITGASNHRVNRNCNGVCQVKRFLSLMGGDIGGVAVCVVVLVIFANLRDVLAWMVQ